MSNFHQFPTLVAIIYNMQNIQIKQPWQSSVLFALAHFALPCADECRHKAGIGIRLGGKRQAAVRYSSHGPPRTIP